MTDLATLVVRMQADNSQYVKALDQATQQLNKFAKDQESALEGLAETIGEVFAADKLLEFAASSIESAASLEKLSQSAGVSVEALGGLQLAFAASGLSQEDMSTSLKKLNVNLSDAAGNSTSKSGEAFRALGVSVTDSSGKVRDAGTVMGDVADKFKDLADGPNKTAIAVQLFGRAGQQLIPILNEGKEGIDDFQKQAEAAGITLSGPAAEAAEKFEQKFAVMKATLSTGFGNQLESQLVPVLNEIADQLTSSASAGQAFATVAGVIVEGVKLVAAGVIETISEFKQLGDSIGAVGAAAVAVASGNFKEASTIWKQSNEDNVSTAASAEARITAIMESGTANELALISTSEAEKKRIRSQGQSLAGVGEYDAAVKKLQEYNDQLKDQAGAFGLGSAALVDYKLQYGPLADAIKNAGDKGKELAASIRANAAALQQKQDTKEITDYTAKLVEQITKFDQGSVEAIEYAAATSKAGQAAKLGADGGAAFASGVQVLAVRLTELKDIPAIAAINDQLNTMKGNLVAAGAAAFDAAHAGLVKDVNATGDTGAQAAIADLRSKTLAQDAYNEEVEKANVIQLQLATTETALAAQQSSGAITELQYESQLDAARLKAVDDLNGVYAAEKKIADDSGLPKLIQQTQQFQNSIVQLQTTTTQLENQVRSGLESAFADNFSKLITGAESFRKALQNFFKDLENQLTQLVSKDIGQQIFGSGGSGGGIAGAIAGVLGGNSGGGGGGAGLLGGLFGGGSSPAIASTANAATGQSMDSLIASLPAFAGGGTLDANSLGIVGEDGPELIHSGARDLQVIPNGAGMGNKTQVTNQFTISAPGGTISRQSQMQTAAAAARSLSTASRRNN